MRIFLFLAVVFISLSFIYKLISFFVFQYQLNNNNVLMIKQPGYKYFNKFHFFGGIFASLAGLAFYKIYELDYIILLWSIVALTQFFNCFISPDGYLIVGKKGIRKHYNEKQILWELIKRVETNKDGFVFYGNKISISTPFSDGLLATQITNLLKEKRTDVYNRLFNS